MKRFVAMILAVLLCVLPLAAQAASPIDGWAEKVKAAKAAKIATNDGLTVNSPEQFLGIDPCDQISQQDNYYYYRYVNAASSDMQKMKEYMEALIATGYYKEIEHDSLSSTNEYWCLGYVGPKTVRTFGVNRDSTQKAAIAVQSFSGDIYVWFSVDIHTDDLDETQERLGIDLFMKKENRNSGTPCSACVNGRCPTCGGYNAAFCRDCSDGKCRYCHGDGWID